MAVYRTITEPKYQIVRQTFFFLPKITAQLHTLQLYTCKCTLTFPAARTLMISQSDGLKNSPPDFIKHINTNITTSTHDGCCPHLRYHVPLTRSGKNVLYRCDYRYRSEDLRPFQLSLMSTHRLYEAAERFQHLNPVSFNM